MEDDSYEYDFEIVNEIPPPKNHKGKYETILAALPPDGKSLKIPCANRHAANAMRTRLKQEYGVYATQRGDFVYAKRIAKRPRSR